MMDGGRCARCAVVADFTLGAVGCGAVLCSQHHAVSARVSGLGAKQMRTQRLAPGVWFSDIGEVPLQALHRFASQPERLR